MEKYYWMCYEQTTKHGVDKFNEVFTEHPFIIMEKLKNESNYSFVLLNYKEITKEEYEMCDL